MSIESAKAFVERLKNDEDWRNKLNSAEGKEERLAMVKAEGFNFTQEELADETGELTHDQLELISGGIRAWCLLAYMEEVLSPESQSVCGYK